MLTEYNLVAFFPHLSDKCLPRNDRSGKSDLDVFVRTKSLQDVFTSDTEETKAVQDYPSAILPSKQQKAHWAWGNLPCWKRQDRYEAGYSHQKVDKWQPAPESSFPPRQHPASCSEGCSRPKRFLDLLIELILIMRGNTHQLHSSCRRNRRCPARRQYFDFQRCSLPSICLWYPPKQSRRLLYPCREPHAA